MTVSLSNDERIQICSEEPWPCDVYCNKTQLDHTPRNDIARMRERISRKGEINGLRNDSLSVRSKQRMNSQQVADSRRKSLIYYTPDKPVKPPNNNRRRSSFFVQPQQGDKEERVLWSRSLSILDSLSQRLVQIESKMGEIEQRQLEAAKTDSKYLIPENHKVIHDDRHALRANTKLSQGGWRNLAYPSEFTERSISDVFSEDKVGDDWYYAKEIHNAQQPLFDKVIGTSAPSRKKLTRNVCKELVNPNEIRREDVAFRNAKEIELKEQQLSKEEALREKTQMNQQIKELQEMTDALWRGENVEKREYDEKMRNKKTHPIVCKHNEGEIRRMKNEKNRQNDSRFGDMDTWKKLLMTWGLTNYIDAMEENGYDDIDCGTRLQRSNW